MTDASLSGSHEVTDTGPSFEALGLGGLHAVRVELDLCLSRARTQVEDFLEDEANTEALRSAAQDLHQIRGTASVIQCFGVAALAEELKQTTLDLAAGSVGDRDAALSALSAGLVQLGDYIDALLSGFNDCVLVLQPLLNELRLSRARPVLTEEDLFVAQMHALSLQLPMAVALTSGGGAQTLARQLQRHFDGAMVRWLKGEDVRKSISTIGHVAESIAAATSEPRMHEFWRFAAAGAELLLLRELPESIELKRLYGRVGNNLRELATNGEWDAQGRIGDDAYHLLFYIGRSRSRARRALQIREALKLDVYLPDPEIISRLRRHLRGPGTALLNRVAAEVRSDLAAIQDRVDLAVRSGSTPGSELKPIESRLRNVSSALQMLGLTALHQLIEQRARTLPTLLAAPVVKLADWMDFATTLLQLEQSLEDALFRQLGVAYRDQSGDDAQPRLSDWRHGVSAVMRESLINVAKIKDAISLLLRQDDSVVPDCGRLGAEVASALAFIGPQAAAEIFARLQRLLTRPALLSLQAHPERAADFADAIAAAELYLESRRDGLPSLTGRLNELMGRLQRFEALIARPADPVPEPSAAAVPEPSVELAVPVVAAPAAAAGDDELDAEMREIFLEEAREVVAELQDKVPRWLRQPDQREMLVEIRRWYHTLKGSGRMVGAGDIGEFAWALENLLNRVLDGTIAVSAAVGEALRSGTELLPELIEAFAARQPAPERAAALAVRAAELSRVHHQDDDALLEVFRQDALERLAAVEQWLAALPAGFAPLVPDNVVRAFHTMRGAGGLVNAPHVGEFTGRVETVLEELRSGEVPLPLHALPLLHETIDGLRIWLAQLGSGAAVDERWSPREVLARIEGLRHSVPESAIRSAADRQLAEIFVIEAFELIESVERNLLAWDAEPASSYLPEAIAAALHTLRGAAVMSSAVAMAGVAQQFRDSVNSIGSAVPGPAFFAAAKTIVEGMYQQLDAYRDGARPTDGEPWLSLAAALPEQLHVEATADAAVMAAAHEPTIEPATPLPPTLAGEAAPVESMAADEAPAVDASASVGQAVQPPAYAELPADYDAELVEIFVAEATEILEDAERLIGRLAVSAADHEAAVELRRAMHTFKGGARMAGFHGMGELAHALERSGDEASRGLVAVDRRFLENFHQQTNRLRHDLGLPLAVSPWPAGNVEDGDSGAAPTWDAAPGLSTPQRQEPVQEVLSASSMPAGLDVPRDAAMDQAAPSDDDSEEAVPTELNDAFGADVQIIVLDEHPEPDLVAADPGAPAGGIDAEMVDDAGQWTLPEAVEPAPFVDHNATPAFDESADPDHGALDGTGVDLAAALSDEAQAIADANAAQIDAASAPEPAGYGWTHPAAADAGASQFGGLPMGDPAELLAELLRRVQPRIEDAPQMGDAAQVAGAQPLDGGDVGSSSFAGDATLANRFDESGSVGWTPPADAPAEVELAMAADGLPADTAVDHWMPEADIGAELTNPDAAERHVWPQAEPPAASDVESLGAPEFLPLTEQYDDAGGHTTPPSAEFDSAASGESTELDQELLEIFAAEAAELLEGLDRDLRRWTVDPDSRDVAGEVLRALHTLKGGARMAGLLRFGLVVHNLETVLGQDQRHAQRPDAAVFAAIEAGIDELHGMLDDVMRGETAAQFDLEGLPPAAIDGDGGEADGPQPAWTPPPSPPDVQPAPPPQPSPGDLPAEGSGWDPMLFWSPDADATANAIRRETARVPVERLDAMLNEAGEISITRSRLEQHNISQQQLLRDTAQTIERLREQLRMLDIETEAQIAARGISRGVEQDRYESEFDPLEMDRYSRMQELSRALAESLGDLAALHLGMDQLVGDSESLLQQQGRINTDIQNGLMGTLMVPFARQTQRLQRVVRQTAAENGRLADVFFEGGDAELDRNVLERMTAPLEHLLRNCVVHGIETPDERKAAGKPIEGRIDVSLRRDGTQLLISLVDDGRGFDVQAIRQTAIKRGLMPADSPLSDGEVIQFIFAPGFSTARKVTQDAGRGIGMDVVMSEVKQLGGLLEIGTEAGRGARFLIRLPLTLAISQSLLVGIAGEQYAIPLPSVEGIVRLTHEQLAAYAVPGSDRMLSYGGHDYAVRSLGDYIDRPADPSLESRTIPAILVRLGEGIGTVGSERRIAIVVDQLLGNRQVVSKAVGQHASSVSGVAGATILADGRVVLILDIPALVQDRARRELVSQSSREAATRQAAIEAAAVHDVGIGELIMVVDDSITMRRVAERLLQRNGFRVVTAKDGLDAMAMLQTELPSAILLDIEMPRADGFEVAAFVRNTDRIAEVPIIMITSRSGDKHRERARQLGVNRYLIKPYQEDQLMGELRSVLSGAAA